MTADETKALQKGARVVERYDDGSARHGEVAFNNADWLAIKWDTGKEGGQTLVRHASWGHLKRKSDRQ